MSSVWLIIAVLGVIVALKIVIIMLWRWYHLLRCITCRRRRRTTPLTDTSVIISSPLEATTGNTPPPYNPLWQPPPFSPPPVFPDEPPPPYSSRSREERHRRRAMRLNGRIPTVHLVHHPHSAGTDAEMGQHIPVASHTTLQRF